MEKYSKKIILGFFMMTLSTLGWSQYSIGGGYSSLFGLNLPIVRHGVNVFLELPKSNDVTFAVRASYMLPTKNIQNTSVSGKDGVIPSVTEADIISKTTYFAIDGGTRYYFINDYDIGFSLYAGGFIKGTLSRKGASYRLPPGLKLEDYQTSDYPPQPLTNYDAMTSVLFSFGGMIGMKYQLPTRGALTLDFSGEVLSRIMDPYYVLGNEISPISYSINLAYRFDWY